jgi:uncharacterized protein YjiS (DUF1127 family)
MYTSNTDAATFDAREGPAAVVAAMGFTEADYAMAYAKDMFKRLTGYSTENRRDRARRAGAENARAMAYAKETFARMKGYRPDHHHDRDHFPEYGVADGGRGAGRVRMAGREAARAMAYARDLFKRLKGVRVRRPFGASFARTAKSEGASANGFFPVANAIGGALAHLARLIRKSVLEPYVRGRRRKIAIAQLEALDDRLLADIGLRRTDIVPAVDRMLARGDDASPPPVIRFAPVIRFPRVEESRHDLPLAA